MIRNYLRLDLFDYSSKIQKLHFIDNVDLEADENLYDLLQGFNSAEYAELCLVNQMGNALNENLLCCFRRIKLKNQKEYQWLACEQEVV